jgi:hypothetical protein
MRKMLLPILAVVAFTPAMSAQDDGIRQALKDYLDVDAKEDAIQELYVDAVRGELQAKGADMQATADLHAIRRVENIFENRRVDPHLAAPGGPTAATALASLSGVSGFLGAALESGVVNRSTQGNLATFRVSGKGLGLLLDPQEPCYLRSEKCERTLEQRLNGLSFSVTFDQGEPKPEDPMTTATVAGADTEIAAGTLIPGLGGSEDFRNFTARWEIKKRRDLRKPSVQEDWKEIMTGVHEQANALNVGLNAYIEGLHEDNDWKTWKALSQAELDAIAADASLSEDEKVARMAQQYRQDLRAYVDNAEGELLSRSVRVAELNAAFRRKRNELLHDALYPTAATLEYLYERPANQPEYSTLRLIIGKPIGEQEETQGAGDEQEAPASQFTFNLGASMYQTPPPGVGSLRDVQAAVQLDRVLPLHGGGERKAIASVAGYYQYLAQKGVLQFGANELTPLVGIPLPQPANVLLDTVGSIFVTQAKLTIPIGDSGVSFPIAVSWANRTELIKANVTKLNFGFTFDLKKLMTQSGGGN